MAADYKLKTPLGPHPAGTPIKVVDPHGYDLLGSIYDIILPDGSSSWAYDYEIDWSQTCHPSSTTQTRSE
jgi:hypothetical protein